MRTDNLKIRKNGAVEPLDIVAEHALRSVP